VFSVSEVFNIKKQFCRFWGRASTVRAQLSVAQVAEAHQDLSKTGQTVVARRPNQID
jgi:hypothetical protein